MVHLFTTNNTGNPDDDDPEIAKSTNNFEHFLGHDLHTASVEKAMAGRVWLVLHCGII